MTAITSVYGLRREPFQPLVAPHPAIGTPCAGCGIDFKAGDTTLFVNGRPGSPEDEAKAAEGRAHNIQVDLAHEQCAYDAIIDHGAEAYP